MERSRMDRWLWLLCSAASKYHISPAVPTGDSCIRLPPRTINSDKRDDAQPSVVRLSLREREPSNGRWDSVQHHPSPHSHSSPLVSPRSRPHASGTGWLCVEMKRSQALVLTATSLLSLWLSLFSGLMPVPLTKAEHQVVQLVSHM